MDDLHHNYFTHQMTNGASSIHDTKKMAKLYFILDYKTVLFNSCLGYV